MTSRERYKRELLVRLQAGGPVTQRALSRELGIALGLTNQLLRDLSRAGWVEVLKDDRSGVQYRLTPDGMAQEARMSQVYFLDCLPHYREIRGRIEATFLELSAGWHAHSAHSPDCARASRKPIVFFGAGDLAEIAFVALQGSGLSLVGVVDDATERSAFFGLPISPVTALQDGSLDGTPYEKLVLMNLAPSDALKERILARGVSPGRLCCLI